VVLHLQPEPHGDLVGRTNPSGPNGPAGRLRYRPDDYVRVVVLTPDREQEVGQDC